MKKVLLVLLAFVLTAFSGWTQPSNYFNGFETSVSPGWDAFGPAYTPTRVASGTNSIVSSDGSWHAEVNPGGGPSGPRGQAATSFAGYSNIFPAQGYVTSLDIYLNTQGGWANDTRFNYIVASSNSSGAHLRDFAFVAGFYNSSDLTGPGAGTDRFIINGQNNAGRGSSYPKDPSKNPIAISATGWYTFEHVFYNNGSNVLAVDLNIYDGNGLLVNSWTLSNPADIIGSNVGGNRYGWIYDNEFSVFAIDNSSLTVPMGTYIGTPSQVTCTDYDVPVTVVGFNNVGSISLILNFDPLLFEYDGVTLNPEIASSIADVYVDGQFILSYDNVGVTLNDNDVLFTLHLTLEDVCAGTGGSTSMTWSDNPGDCEYAAPGGSPVYVTSFFDVFFSIDGDGDGPDITCPSDVTIECDDPQDPANTGGFATAEDFCTATPDIEVTYNDNTVPGTCVDTYVINRTWTAEDDCGNTSDCVQVITVKDLTPPSLKNSSIDCSSLDITGVNECLSEASNFDATTLYASVEALYEDNCDADLDVTLVGTAPGNSNDDCSWSFTYTFRIEDNCENYVECNVTRSGSDQEEPEITCATPLAEYATDDDVCTYTVANTLLDPVYTYDNCGIKSVINDYNSSSTLQGATFPLGSTTVTWTITDNCDLTATCFYDVIVVDNQAPVPPADDDETVECVADAVPPTVPQALDYCDGLVDGVLFSVVDDPDPLECEGTRVYTYSYTDLASNTSYWTYTYNIVRTIAPTVPPAGSSTVACPADAVPPLQKPEQEQLDITPTEFMELNNSCGQSFTCGFSGMLTKIDIHIYSLAAPQTGLTLKVFNGNGILGTQIYSGSGYAVTSTGWQTLDIPDNLAPILTSGNQYTFWLEGYTYDALKASLGYLAPGGPYTLGEAWDFPILANYPDHDMVYRTYVEPVVTDYCGVPIAPSTPVISGTNTGCEGTIIYTYTYTDCAGLSTDWVYTYTVEYEDFTIADAPGGSTVDCPDDTDVEPVPPVVYDNCGVELTPVLTGTDPKPVCEGTRTYTFTYTDCDGNSNDWTYTYTVDYEDFVITDAPGGSTVDCPADTDVEPIPPTVYDNCDVELIPVLTGVDPKPACEGTRTYTFTYTDCSGFNHDWTYTYTVDYLDFTIVPSSDGTTVECPDATDVEPTPPSVTDNCGVTLTPSGPVVSSKPACEGERTYTWTYTDCSGFTHDWVYTYTVDRTINPTVPDPEGSIIACAAEALPPIQAVDQEQLDGDPGEYLELNTSFGQSFTCGDAGKLVKIDVHITKLDYPQSGLTLKVYQGDGLGTLIYSGAGYALTATGWQTLDIPDNLAPILSAGTQYTFWLEGYAFNTVWATLSYFYTGGPYTGGKAWDFPVLANYPDHDMAFVTFMEPVIYDYCGVIIPTPVPVISGGYDGCEGTIVYTYTYTDCAGQSSGWVYTYTVEREPFDDPADAGSTIACAADAVTPTLPVVYDDCGTELTASGPVVSNTPDCEGIITYYYSFTDCEGNWQDWVYTYTIEYNDFTMPANDGLTVDCPDDTDVEPVPPTVYDYCGELITPVGPDVSTKPTCEGTRTYTWTYTDCEGNTHDWVYTYTVEYETFADPADDGSTIACADDATIPVPPTVYDNCGYVLSPSGPIVSAVPDCEGIITYFYSFTDCEGNWQDWVYTYTIDYEDFNMPADEGLTVDCPDDTDVEPVPPTVYDYCGELITPVGPDVSTKPTCEGDRTYTWTYTDCAGNTHDWVYTYSVEYETFADPADDGTTIACAADAVPPALPLVVDNCGNTLSPVGAPDISAAPDCEGTITYLYTFADCEGNEQNWIFTYTIEYEDFTMPADDGLVVDCPDDTDVEPVAPTVYDYCGELITPVGPVVSDKPTCEGDRTYTWTYTDCEGNTHDWVFTYTVEYETFADPADDGSTIACADEAVTPALPTVYDNCGYVLTPTGPDISSAPACEGIITYTYVYTDCEGNWQDWVYTYTIDYENFSMPADDGAIVDCPDDTDVEPVPPTVYDYCGALITPVGPEVSDKPICEGTRTYTWTYTDCAGNSNDWIFTYTIVYEDFTIATPPGESTVDCPDDSDVEPTPPVVYDNCGYEITPTGPVVSAKPACEGDRTYTWTYTDCSGFTHDWVYTYTVTRGELNGKLMYYNTPKTPMNNVTLTLVETGATSITDGNGDYSFTNLCPGIYTVRVTNINKPVGYINSSDAAAVNSWFAGQIPIEHVKWNAGDVNWFYDVNSTDAKAIQNYFVYPGNPLYAFDRGPWTFWKAGSLVNNNGITYPEIYFDDFTVEVCGNTTADIYGMGVGDFNGSFVPGNLKGGNESLDLVYNETRQVDASMDVELPVTVKSSSIVGAVSLILNFPSEHMSVTSVTMDDTQGQLDWSAVGNELRIGWHTLQPVWIGTDENLLTIKIRTSETFSKGDVIYITLANDPLCELADGNYNVIPGAIIGIDAIEFSTYGIVDPSVNSGLTFECRPNPFNVYTTLSYTLPADGHVTLQITDMIGRKVAVLADEFQISGKYSFKLDALPLQPGVYNAQIILHNSSGDLIKTLKLVRNQ